MPQEREERLVRAWPMLGKRFLREDGLPSLRLLASLLGGRKAHSCLSFRLPEGSVAVPDTIEIPRVVKMDHGAEAARFTFRPLF